ncbi:MULTISPECIES: hypothetical protein [unclassified Pseudomonas]|uniref:PP_RS20740 family protein n=1 Tax=unclassified Pseudomonas TaxID=196821 RepID=UPI002B2256D2|nr:MULTISPECIES: hypothetical protein [unclassified Pseudomonas]MEB0047830.1 hypothetical protein [Pseudomonas sp. Dout3]MEB0098344.1 hypothetical protein [Pseudomonas sp. DC1.2]
MISRDSGEDLAEDLGLDVGHSTVSLKTKFLPWHKPRKQYIRNNQWNSVIVSLVDALDLKNKSRSLEYLSLPGPDLLDVRSLYAVCADKEVRIRFTGLNAIAAEDKDATMDQLISLDELRGLQYIDPSSDVHPDYLERLSNKNSIAYQTVIKQAPTYDVINIDLCGSFLESPPKEKQNNYYEALFELLRYQADNRTEDWLFFITTRTNKDMVHAETFERFVKVLEGIFDVDKAVYDKCHELKIFSEEVLVDRRIDRTKVDPFSFNNLVSAGIGKWVLSALTAETPAYKSKMLKLFGYNVLLDPAATCDMISFGFWCTKMPTKAVDAFGLAAGGVNLNSEDVDVAVSKCRVSVIDSISKIVDVDMQLASDEAFEEALTSSVSLMRSARYDVDSYVAWARKEHVKVKQLLAARG